MNKWIKLKFALIVAIKKKISKFDVNFIFKINWYQKIAQYVILVVRVISYLILHIRYFILNLKNLGND
jgi:hypothetical protein